MNIQLIAMDLDGTALRADRVSFSPRLDRALLEACRRGVAVVPVTGRQFFILPPAVRRGAAWEGIAVLCNGGEIRRLADGQLLFARYLDAAALLPLLEAAAGLGLPIELSAGGRLHLTEESWQYQRETGGPLAFRLGAVLAKYGQVEEDLSAFCRNLPGPVDKVNLPYVPDGLRGAVEEALSALPVSWFWSGPNSVEAGHPGASKAAGMLEACRLLGVDPARTMALGDGGNDIPMLRAAGLGVAMGNAPAEVRAAAGAVTSSNEEDGAALAVERCVLGEGSACFQSPHVEI